MNNIKNIISKLLLITLITIGISSCNEKTDPDPEVIPDTRRTILVYMVASNSLGSYGYDDKDIVEMENAMKTYNYNDCRLLIYHVPKGSNSDINLIEISAKDDVVTTDTLKTYSADISSLSPERFSQVFSDMKSFAPADDYGLVLWSHATGWSCDVSTSGSSTTYSLEDAETGNKILTRTFGDDNDDSISITSLAETIPAGLFSFIYADACYMGGVEVAYQLRNVTNYFIGSPTTLYAAGMPYNENILYFFETEANLVAACEATYNYYQGLSGTYQTNTIVLVDCTKLEDLATACRKIVSNPKDYTLSNIQKYITSTDYRYVFNYNYIAYDLKDYCLAISQDEYIDEFNAAFEDAVLYCAATKYIFANLYIDPDKFFGLSTYILGTGNTAQEEYYISLDWYKAIY